MIGRLQLTTEKTKEEDNEGIVALNREGWAKGEGGRET